MKLASKHLVLWLPRDFAGHARLVLEVDTAQTATEAAERLAARRYAAILSDCVLPDLPPLEWLAVARGSAPNTPLVVYSGAVHLDELKALAREWRVVTVLAKLFSPAELGAAVRGAIAADGWP